MSGTATRLQVLDPAGRPAAGALVTVVRSSVPFPEIALVADERGEVRLVLPDGEFTFRCDAAGRTGEATARASVGGQVIIRLE